MSIPVDGQSFVPPGFRFHPTEEELLNYYLRKKVASERIDLDVIRDVDLNKLEPWDIQDKCRIGSTPQNDWYFFSHKDKKYPTGTRTNRATAAGFWKATGRDKVIYASCKRIGMRKTLVFYMGRAPHGQKSDWIMHEYRLDEHPDSNSQFNASCQLIGEAAAQEDGWVVCRVFKKKNHQKAAMDSPNNCSSITCDTKTTQMLQPPSDGTLDQILQYMGRSCKQETEAVRYSKNNLGYFRPIEAASGHGIGERFMKLPALESPPAPSFAVEIPPPREHEYSAQTAYSLSTDQAETGLSDWAALDRLVASHLNAQSETSKQLACFDDPGFPFCSSGRLLLPGAHDFHGGSDDGNNGDLWSLTRSASAPSMSDHISHVSSSSL